MEASDGAIGNMVNDISARGFRWLVIRQSDRKFVKIGTATTKEEAMAAAQTAKRELEAAEKSGTESKPWELVAIQASGSGKDGSWPIASFNRQGAAAALVLYPYFVGD